MKKSEINILTARLRGSRVVTRSSGKYIDFGHSQSVFVFASFPRGLVLQP